MNGRVIRSSFLFLPLLVGCASFGAPRPQTLATVAPMPLAAGLPGRFEIELASPGLTGTFDGVCAVSGSTLRVQLFPDVGGKVLDVAVGPDGLTAEWPGGRYEATPPLDRAEPHLALFVALLFGELCAPVRGERVLGERAGRDGGLEVRLQPWLGAGTVTAALAADGAVTRYDAALGWIDVTLNADGSFAGRSVRGALTTAGPR